MDRRDFLKVMGGVAGSILLPSYTNAKETTRILQNEDKPGFYVRFYKPFQAVEASKWSLDVSGLCESPGRFTLQELKQIPKVTQISRLKCVECWSVKAKWGGFAPTSLFEIVKPKDNGIFLYFECADAYYEYVSLEDLSKPRVLFVYELNDGPLPDEHGAPLRVIIPFKYGYKNVKTITKLRFVDYGRSGYWSNYGYSPDALIQPGVDQPLDLVGKREITKFGELHY